MAVHSTETQGKAPVRPVAAACFWISFGGYARIHLSISNQFVQGKEKVMKVRIEPRDECLGDGICSDECPEVFEMDEDGLAKVIMAEPGDDLREAV
ncbi:MAG: ferredoxin, partial [Actinomycetota bacterium]